MFNRLTNVFAETASPGAKGRWQTDVRPTLRLTWLGVLMLLPLIAIAGRVAYLQTSTADKFAQPFEQTFVSFESVPSRDGRLLSADGRVLAVDRRQFTVKVHYRWLEEPADSGWLKAQTLAKLSRSDRRKPELVAQARENVLAEREAMWKRLSQLTGYSVEDLATERTKIQNRVEGIVELVEDRRQQKVSTRSTLQDSRDATKWQLLWKRFSHSFTTPPSRQHRDPVIIKEEQDYHALLSGVSLAAVAEIESHPELYPGLQVDTISWRDYPQDRLAAHLIGIRKPMTAEETEKRRKQFANRDPLDFQVGDRLGRMGLEQMYDHQLHGLQGRRKVVRNRRGEIIRTELVREPRPGGDLLLTLNAGLQDQLELVLDKTLRTTPGDEAPPTKPKHAGASLVILDVRTGAVMAAVSAPRFSLQELLHPTPERWRAMTTDPRRPFFHRVTHMTVAPGSVFKAITAVALLESGKFDPDAPQYCQGFLDRPDRHRCYIYSHYGVGHGDLNLSHALCRSCNVYFFRGARKIGPDPLVHWAERFGIGRTTGIDLPGEQPGNLPKPPPRQQPSVVPVGLEEPQEAPPPWYPGDTLGLAIGQSRLTVTPLQMARVMAAIANGGFLVTPHLVKGPGPVVVGGSETPQSLAPPEPLPIPGLTDGTLSRVREGLEMVVAHPKGTGFKTVRMNEVKIAGKTGTAEVGGGLPDHAWFAGYVPAERPKYAFAIVLEHAGSGGRKAGPIARQTVEILLELGLIAGQDSQE